MVSRSGKQSLPGGTLCALARMGLLVFALFYWAQLPVAACSYHDTPEGRKNIQKGLLNSIYPESLHVRWPIWQAQAAGQLPSDETLSFQKTARVLMSLNSRFGALTPADRAEQFSMILVENVLWSQFNVKDSKSLVAIDAAGPIVGHLVVVTDEPVLYALAKNSLSLLEAVKSGLMRLYGQPNQVDIFLNQYGEIGIKKRVAT